MLLSPNAGKYKWLLQGKGSQIQINNKTIIEFGSRRKWEIIKASVCLTAGNCNHTLPSNNLTYHLNKNLQFTNGKCHIYKNYHPYPSVELEHTLPNTAQNTPHPPSLKHTFIVTELEYMKKIFPLIDLSLWWRANRKWITSENIHTSPTLENFCLWNYPLIIFVKVFVHKCFWNRYQLPLIQFKKRACLTEYLSSGGIQMESCLT